jgi:hypothetical protein
MSMSRQDWYRRYFTPTPGNVVSISLDHRDRDIKVTLGRAGDVHALGQMLYHDVLAKQDGGKEFDGTAEWFVRAFDRGWVPKPTKQIPITLIRHAILMFNEHCRTSFNSWANACSVPSFGSYLAYLRKRQLRDDRGRVIVAKHPVTDTLHQESIPPGLRAGGDFSYPKLDLPRLGGTPMTDQPDDQTRQPLYPDNPDGPVSAPTDRTSTPASEIRTPSNYEPIYAWQMHSPEQGWNIIGMRMPNGTTLPMVTTDLRNAWSLFEVAQAHANVHGVQCRLAGWAKPEVVAIVDPEVER